MNEQISRIKYKIYPLALAIYPLMLRVLDPISANKVGDMYKIKHKIM